MQPSSIRDSIFGLPHADEAPPISRPTLGGTTEEICAHGPDEIILDRLRDSLRTLTTKSARNCGHLPRRRRGDPAGPDKAVTIVVERDANGRSHASFREAVYCKSGYACPPCIYRRRVAAAADLRRIVATWRANGGEASTLSLTVGHRRAHKLRIQRKVLRSAWRVFSHGRPYKRVMKELGVVHVLHTMEITHGASAGWHPHIHALLLTNGADLSAKAKKANLSILRAQWLSAVGKALATSKVPSSTRSQYLPSIRRGVSLTEMAGTGDYIVKFGLDPRVDAPAVDERGRPAWAVMLGAAAGDDSDRALWREFTDAMRGQHLLEGLTGVLRALGLPSRPATFSRRRKTPVAVMPDRIYRSLARIRGAIPRVLYAAENTGLRGVALSVAADVFGVIARDPTRPPAQVHRLIRLFNPAGPCAHPSTWLPAGEAGGPTLKHLRRSRAIVLSLARRRLCIARASVAAAAA